MLALLFSYTALNTALRFDSFAHHCPDFSLLSDLWHINAVNIYFFLLLSGPASLPYVSKN